MPIYDVARRPLFSRHSLHRGLLASASALTLLAVNPAEARNILSTGGASGVVTNATAGAIAAAQQAGAAAAQAQNSLSRATQALQAAQAAQNAARALVLSAPNMTVPNGLTLGGLAPAVTAPMPAALDPTGLATWEGANLPTQANGANGAVNVTIRQNQNNAVLSWKTFNVGSKTTLTFDQQGNADWVALNRVTDPTAAPSKILGAIKADGTVLVINRNGIIFGAGAQVNSNALIASSLDIGGDTANHVTIQQRNLQFEQGGLLGASNARALNVLPDFSPDTIDEPVEGDVAVEAGATITVNTTPSTSGLILLVAPHVVNAGSLSAPDGQVALESGRYIFITPSTGASDSVDPNVRGLVFAAAGSPGGTNDYYAWNQSTGLIEADRGNISMGSTTFEQNGVPDVSPVAAVINDGVLLSTTSVSRNGSIVLNGGSVRLSQGSLLAVEPDTNGETIPTDPTTLSEFKTSVIEIGRSGTNSLFYGTGAIEIDNNATVYAPSGNITIGNSLTQGVSIGRGAIIDASGLENVLIPATRNQVTITPVKGNELADDPDYRAGFLNGATVYLDPRLSGVREDGVAWVGSPLIDAETYYQLVGVSASELMTKGGNVSLNSVSGVIVKSSAVINIAGGWVTYLPGTIRTTDLIDTSGHIIPIDQADPLNDTFIGIYSGFTVNHPHWGVTETFANGWRPQTEFAQGYTEGRDAGSLSIAGGALVLDATIDAQAFPGERQILGGQEGTGTSSVAGDQRLVQGANSQLPAGGFLGITLGGFLDASSAPVNGGDIQIVAGDDYKPLPGDTDTIQTPQVGADGSLMVPTSAPVSPLSTLMARLTTATLSDRTLSGSGLSDISLSGNGGLNVARDAVVDLGDGGVFSVLAGHAITINGTINAPSGTIALQTYNGVGSVASTAAPALRDFDININGSLSVAGRWVNDLDQPDDAIQGGAWLNGGTISAYAAPRILSVAGEIGDGSGLNDPNGGATYQSPASTDYAQDISGSILINPGAHLDLSGGGRIDQKGNFTLTAKGGNLSLKSDTTYFQLFANSNPGIDLSGFRVANPISFSLPDIRINPDAINARVAIDPGAIEAHGFGGGGTFTLTTPEFGFGTGAASIGTLLPMNFFSAAGFATYNITSYKTAFLANTFTDDEGGYNAVLATQTLTIGAGQNLSLQQSFLSNQLTLAQRQGLLALPSGGNIFSIIQASIPTDAWDQKPISLTVGGLIELDVDQGGSITGAAGSALTVSKLLNDGTIRIPGGTLTQQEILPAGYAAAPAGTNAVPNPNGGIHQLSDILNVAPDGSIDPDAPSKVTFDVDGTPTPPTNAQLVAGAAGGLGVAVYFLGQLDQNQGIVLAPGSVTDLSGTVIINPYAAAANGRQLVQGRIVAGGTIAAPVAKNTAALFTPPRPSTADFYNNDNPTGQTDPDLIVAQPGSTLNISGASGLLDQFVGGTSLSGHGVAGAYVMTPVWSDAGSIVAGNGGTFTGATILAHGGAPQANGGTLQILDPILAQHDPSTPANNVISADMIANSGIDTLVAIGSVGSLGDATIRLGNAFFLQDRTELAYSANTNSSNSTVAIYHGTMDTDIDAPRVSVGVSLKIEAPYISFNSQFDVINNPVQESAGTGSVVFQATDIDFTGSAIFDASVTRATLQASGDIRFTGVPSWESVFEPLVVPPSFTLNGALAVNGNLSLIAGQVYPTTGSSYVISSTATDGTISFGRSSDILPATPYSAGGNLSVQAAHIVQGGVIRVPFGSLTLGSNTGFAVTNQGAGITTVFSPATRSVTFTSGSVTSVSAGGLDIPYGTTTDETEWFFSPTSSQPIIAPPAKIMTIAGSSIEIDQGATLDISGGGDVYAYEFVPGTGGTHDVLSQQNPDQFTGNKGLAYPDGRQVYAIVPGLSDNPTAPRDPIYSANYAALSSPSGAGQRVYLSGGNGLAAGWYTLLPAQYALLPGGMRVVEQTGVTNAASGAPGVLPDGGLLVSGYYGDAFSGSSQSQIRQFSVESRTQILAYSQIATSSGATLATTAAETADVLTPRLGIDAGRLVLNPQTTLIVNAPVLTAPRSGGRGAEVDIGGANIDILSSADDAPSDGAIHVTAASLDNLNAESLLIGATRTDAVDGTTSLIVSAQHILVANNAANPLEAPEIVLVVDDLPTNSAASTLTLADGATIIANGTVNDTRHGAYVIDGTAAAVPEPNNPSEIFVSLPLNTATGALFRVSNGPQRTVSRETNADTPMVPAATLSIGNIMAQGQSVTLDTSNNFSLATNAIFKANSLALDAPSIVFSASSAAVPGAVVIDPTLQASLSQAGSLILHAQTSIGFDNGDYRFGTTTFDAQDLVARQGGMVMIDAGDITFANDGTLVVAVAGGGTLDIDANSVTFGAGGITTSGFGAVNLTGATGMFIGAAGGSFDVGSAVLTLTTPYLGDRAVTGEPTEAAGDLTITTSGTVAITSAGMAPLDADQIAGLSGSGLTINGNGITVSGTTIRATSGSLSLISTAGITLSDNATVEAPGYARTFGDSVDPVTQAAPGGTLTLSAAGSSGIVLGGATLSVGSGTGNAGTLVLSAPNGAVDLSAAHLDGTGGAGGSGGTFSLDTASAVDLVALNTRVGADGFTSAFNIHTETGDIVLGAGETLRSGSVNLTADGGFVTIAGTIDTSGIDGGDIALYGVRGVTLQGTARLDAFATGYAADDSRQAHAGDVTLGTDFLPGTAVTNADGSVTGTSGAIDVVAGAIIDISAKRPGDRLVELLRNGTVFYQFAEGDMGGMVTFRAPVVSNGAGGNTVNVSVAGAGSVVGAREIDLEGFKRWDLEAVAKSDLYSGVTYDPTANTVTIDVSAGLDTANPDGTLTTVAGLNFLGDKGAGALVDFVQNYDVSADYGHLGGLASQANFQARPGIELDHTGNITLASNWNLGAGVVNVAAAEAAGLMAVDPISGQVYVIPGDEGALLAGFAAMTYRVGGKATGAAPIVSFRAGGDLHLEGSLSDGFFEFRDQYDPTYLSFENALPPANFNITLQAEQFFNDTYENYADYLNDFGAGGNYFLGDLGFGFLQAAGAPPAVAIPYSALGNSPAALGSGPGGVGDPLGNAEVFPLLSSGRFIASSSYRLTAGAALGAVDPAQTVSAATGSIIVDGPKPETLTVTDAPAMPGGTVLQINGPEFQSLSFNAGASGFDAFLEQNLPGVSSNTEVSLVDDFGQYQPFIIAFAAAHPGVTFNRNNGFAEELDMPLSTMALFVQQVLPQIGSIAAGSGGGNTSTTSINLIQQTVIRTGTGDIKMAAAGNVDLTGGPTVQYVDASGNFTTSQPTGFPPLGQAGGAAVYTVGHPVILAPETLADPVTGAAITIDPASIVLPTNVFSQPPTSSTGVVGLLYSNQVALDGGGDISISAGQDVLGRHDLSLELMITSHQQSTGQIVGGIGLPAEPWRVLEPSGVQNEINPQAFRSAVGALGGGGITIDAGRDVSDLTVDSDHSVLIATAIPAGGVATQVALAYGSGNLGVAAGRDILGGNMEIANGMAQVSAGRNIAEGPESITGLDQIFIIEPDGSFQIENLPHFFPNPVQLSIDDATIGLEARGSITFQGVTALGAADIGTSLPNAVAIDLLDREGLYSAHSGLTLLANGEITASNVALGSESVNLTIGSSADVYPGSLSATSIVGDLNFKVAAPSINNNNSAGDQAILLVPSPIGQLRLFAAGDILPTAIAMLDADLGELPGLFPSPTVASSGTTFAFPGVEPNTPDLTLQQYHNKKPTHENDPEPVYIYADGSIGDDTRGVTLSVPKQARIDAGEDIVNMMFFGQNLLPSDVTRIVAGRDITATTQLTAPLISNAGGSQSFGTPLPALLGNTFVLGGPGELFLEAGRNMGPFLNSATISLIELGTGLAPGNADLSFGGGILSVGNDWNPYLPKTGADVNVLFGVAKGADFDALRDDYVAPGSAANALGDYSDKLIAWMQQNQAQALVAAYGTTDIDADQAYTAFTALPELSQQTFLLADVYFNELRETADTSSSSYLVYSRGYQAVNTLFPASLGYTANSLNGGANGASQTVQTGNLDLRLATIETTRGGDIRILGPGGNVLAGSVVGTSVQASRRAYNGYGLFGSYVNPPGTTIEAAAILSIPTGTEGVLTLRGGNIDSFTDGSFLVNQSRVFTEEGGDITMWSSNADLNAGKGAKTTASFPPIVVHIDDDAFSEVDAQGGVTGAGIATLQSTPDSPPGDAFLIAPRGTVDAGDAGVRVSGNLSVAALLVLNADNFQVKGTATGLPTIITPNISGLASANNVAGAADQAAEAMRQPVRRNTSDLPSIITVEVIGYGGGDGSQYQDLQNNELRKKQRERQSYNQSSPYQVLGVGTLTDEEADGLAAEKRAQVGMK